MCMKHLFYFSIAFIFTFKICLSIEQDHTQTTRYVYVIVPGQGDFGGTEHDGKLPQTIPEHYKEIVRIKSPGSEKKTLLSSFSSNKDDFGQTNCQDLLSAQLDELFAQANIKFIIHAYSQGTASILNYISNLELADVNKDEKRTSKIEALILESAMISGFSAITHFTGNHFRFASLPIGKICRWLPYSDYWIPILAKFTTFPDFDINGVQTIDILHNIPKKLPIIIMHTPYDYVLPYDGALTLYQMLEGNENLYFITVKRKIHIDMTCSHVQRKECPTTHFDAHTKGQEARIALVNILKKLGIYKSNDAKENNFDASAYQPIFDKKFKIKHTTHVANTRHFYNTLTSSITTLGKFSPLMALGALTYTHYRISR